MNKLFAFLDTWCNLRYPFTNKPIKRRCNANMAEYNTACVVANPDLSSRAFGVDKVASAIGIEELIYLIESMHFPRTFCTQTVRSLRFYYILKNDEDFYIMISCYCTI